MTATMHKHGGIHEWDISLPEAREAIYVNGFSPCRANSLLRHLSVVQCHFSGICPDHSLHEISHSSTLPPSISATAMGLLRLGAPCLYDRPDHVLHRHYYGQDIRVYSTKKDMEQVCSGDLY